MLTVFAQRVRSLILILNLKSLIIVALAVASTYFCRATGIVADFPMAVVLTAVVFPIVFSINAAYQRRESALAEYASIKAHGQALYLAARDWLDSEDSSPTRELKTKLDQMFSSMQGLLTSPNNAMNEHESSVYRSFSELSVFIRDSLRRNGLASGEVSRCNQFLSRMLVSFETLKHIYQYRTPIGLRAFSDLFLVLLPVLYGPYFAYLGGDYGALLACIPPFLFSLVLVTLDNIQEHLENPFDQVGEDDIDLDSKTFLQRLTAI